MKRRSVLAWLLVLVLCVTLTACRDTMPTSDTGPTTAVTTETTATTTTTTETAPTTTTPSFEAGKVTPLLYRVTDGEGGTLWLFGSIHVGRNGYYPLPAYVLDAFDEADALAVEVDVLAFEKDLAQQMTAMTSLVYTDGSSIREHISEELYERAVAILKKHSAYTMFLDYYCPMFWSSTIDTLYIEELGGDPSLGIDRHLLKRAKDADKEVREVESAAFQYQMMADFSPELQEMLLESSVEMYDNPEEAKTELQKMMNLWAAGDEEGFAAYLASEGDDLTGEEAELYAEYDRAMVEERNLSMADYAEDALRSGDEVFICVGAAHVVGDGAMAQLLAERGYTVECVTP